MKSLLLVSLLWTAPAIAMMPICVNKGTANEGWKLENGQILPEACSGKVAYCEGIGTEAEGWFVAVPLEMKQLGYANCAEFEGTRPDCINIGTRSEGWATPGRILYDKCEKKVSVCSSVGTRSEGWFAAVLDESTITPLVKTQCSKFE